MKNNPIEITDEHKDGRWLKGIPKGRRAPVEMRFGQIWMDAEGVPHMPRAVEVDGRMASPECHDFEGGHAAKGHLWGRGREKIGLVYLGKGWMGRDGRLYEPQLVKPSSAVRREGNIFQPETPFQARNRHALNDNENAVEEFLVRGPDGKPTRRTVDVEGNAASPAARVIDHPGRLLALGLITEAEAESCRRFGRDYDASRRSTGGQLCERVDNPIAINTVAVMMVTKIHRTTQGYQAYKALTARSSQVASAAWAAFIEEKPYREVRQAAQCRKSRVNRLLQDAAEVLHRFYGG